MAQNTKAGDARSKGVPLWLRLTLSMSVTLALVMSGAGFFIYQSANQIALEVEQKTLTESVQLTSKSARADMQAALMRNEHKFFLDLEQQIAKDLTTSEKLWPNSSNTTTMEVRRALIPYQQALHDQFQQARAEREKQYDTIDKNRTWQPAAETGVQMGDSGVQSFEIEYGPDKLHGFAYQFKPAEDQDAFYLLVPDLGETSKKGLLGIIVGATLLVVLIGAVMSVYVANLVSKPIERIAEEVRQISTGDLRRRASSRGTGEMAVIGRSINKMTKTLAAARETEFELQVRQREVEVAGEVRQALFPHSAPKMAGYDLGAEHISSPELGGDFHDFVEHGDGRVGLLVCEVSGTGVPALLVGATARAYLRAELVAGGDLKAALQKVNRQLARDVHRGAAVTAMFALVDPREGIATVACAGHKIPMLRYTAADKKLRTIQPEGIALGFDKGPVFDSRLVVEKVPIEHGDRLVIVNSGAVAIVDQRGVELGEKPLYGHVLRHGALGSAEFLERLRSVLETYADGAALPRDVSIVTIARA
jgi:serine phosphatase RsbU (regulator of sigma subunit)